MKIAAFGDSNVNILNGLNFDRRIISIYKLKGVNIKGLLNKNNSYNKIVNILNNKKYDICFFIFGSVDLNFYYFYKKYQNNDDQIFEKIKKYMESYVHLIKNLPNIKIPIILNIPIITIIDNFDYRRALKIYEVLDDDIKVSNDDLSYKNRKYNLDILNNLLEIHCKRYKIKFCNINKYCVDSNNICNNNFICHHNKCNIHPNFENLLIIYLNFCLSFLFKLKNFPSYNEIINNLKDFQYKYYLRELYKKYPNDKCNIDKIVFNKKNIQKYIKKLRIK